MKQLSDYLTDYYTYSGNASTVSRQAAYAAIAIIWTFNKNNNYLPKELLWPSLFIIICLALDLLQYIWASAAWGCFHRKKELELNGSNEPISAPIWLNWPTLLFFWGKLLSIAIGYAFLICYLFYAIKFGY